MSGVNPQQRGSPGQGGTKRNIIQMSSAELGPKTSATAKPGGDGVVGKKSFEQVWYSRNIVAESLTIIKTGLERENRVLLIAGGVLQGSWRG